MMSEAAKEKQKARMKVWRAANGQHIKDYQKQWRQANTKAIAEYNKTHGVEYRQRAGSQLAYWKRNLRINYGISIEDFNRLWSDQNGECAVCGVEMLPRGRVPRSACVDHNHETGEIRGLLCRACNRGFGCFTDSPEVLESAAKYLRAFGHSESKQQESGA